MTTKRIVNTLLFLFLLSIPLSSQSLTNSPGKHWSITAANQISFDIDQKENLPYADNIEMAGKRVAVIINYEMDTLGKLKLDRQVLFPQMHEFGTSEDTWFYDFRAYLKDNYSDDLLPKLYTKNRKFIPGQIKSIDINGMLDFEHHPSVNGLVLSRSLFPSMDQRMFIEKWILKNDTDSTIVVKSGNTSLQLEDYGAKGKFTRRIVSDAPDQFSLEPNEEISFSLKIMAKFEHEEFPIESADEALINRKSFLEKMSSALQLETPNPTLNTLFAFSKIRAAESIYESEMGLVHSPGGGRYYVGFWANDQAEYINPFFPYLGYDLGLESAMNTYRAFAKETNPEYNYIRYAFEMENLVRVFMLDRGDAAMIAYGAAHYAMASGDAQEANELWPLIEWCLEYSHRQMNDEDVIDSESDEMEGRIETGTANLSTSSLYYGALIHSADLARSLNKPKSMVDDYKRKADKLEKAIEDYFGANVEGLKTYKYYKEHKYLRHWICLPLVMGINKRKDGTVEALFDRLWTDNGVHVEKNSDNPEISKIFWDRGTLYALRGTFFSGSTEKSLEKLEQFSEKRLLGNRVPYVVEAFPEGNMAHLSAESALYCRVFTEGVFGIVPTGLKNFKCTPRLPRDWEFMMLKNIKAFGRDFTIDVRRDGKKLRIKVLESNGNLIFDKKVKDGEPVQVDFK